jgi:hypothetical protein
MGYPVECHFHHFARGLFIIVLVILNFDMTIVLNQTRIQKFKTQHYQDIEFT